MKNSVRSTIVLVAWQRAALAAARLMAVDQVLAVVGERAGVTGRDAHRLRPQQRRLLDAALGARRPASGRTCTWRGRCRPRTWRSWWCVPPTFSSTLLSWQELLPARVGTSCEIAAQERRRRSGRRELDLEDVDAAAGAARAAVVDVEASRAGSGTAVAVCEPQPVGRPASLPVDAMRSCLIISGLVGSEMSKMWMPSKPEPTSWPAHVELGARRRVPGADQEVAVDDDVALADVAARVVHELRSGWTCS